ncbi:MAG: lysophospholipid acyltransferase family protein [Paludibacteraceae bacterium]
MMSEREQVIENIRRAVESRHFHAKVEVSDPVLNEDEVRHLLYQFLRHKQSPAYGVRNFIARRIADAATFFINRDTQIIGAEKLRPLKHRAAIITSNHFSPLDNTVLRHLMAREQQGQLLAISQDTNFAMSGLVGFLLKYVDVIPISRNQGYMCNFFYEQLQEAVQHRRWVLMYPEAEMWFNYRKPRPCRRGAYFYAHKLNVPVISCFVKIDDQRTDPALRRRGRGKDAVGTAGRLRYTLYILDPIYPDASLRCKEDSERMASIDYAQRTAAYEQAYGKPLNYTFEPWDIAGYHEPTNH